MKIEILSSKIHRARVTDANLNYVGSITIGPELIEAAGLCEYQKVEILNVNNGERFATYVIKGKKGEISYFAPWNNFVIYYGYQPYYEGIVRLGVIDGDVGLVAKDGEIKIEPAK